MKRGPDHGMIGPYEIQDVLGSGGMGVVYRAWDQRLGRRVAIKVLLPEVIADVEALRRFEREVQAVAALSHPNILGIYDFQRDGESVYAVMELLTGGTLRERLKTGPMPPRKAVEVGVQVARGLAAAHEQHFVHRDLKPENIAFTRDGRVKILDFGLARQAVAIASTTGDVSTRPLHTTPGLVLGTVGYMSPEQVRGQEVDPRSDLFALGAILHEMMTGRRAFAGDTTADTMSAILNEDVRDLSDSGVSVPPALDRVVRRCLEKHPSERFHSARDLAFALENAVGSSGHKTEGRTVSRRSWTRLGQAVALAAAGVAVGIGVMVWRAPAAVAPVRVRPLTLSNLDSAPSASPDGRVIAFASSRRDGISRIWLKDLFTGDVRPFTEGPGDRLPRYAATGDRVFWVRRQSGVDTVLAQAANGTVAQDLVKDAVEAEPSPDGKRLAFVRYRSNDPAVASVDTPSLATVRVMGIGGEAAESELLAGRDVEFTSLRWSPDGARLAAIQRDSTRSNLASIVVINMADGGVEATWAPEGGLGSYGTLAWSGDSRHLIATQKLDSSQVYVPGALGRVALVDSDTGRSRTLLYQTNLFGLFGSVFSNARIDVLGEGQLLFENVQMWHNLEERPLASDVPDRGWIGTAGQSLDRQPAYSPDGQSVIFSSNRNSNLDLWLATADGGLFQLTSDDAADWDPSFSPDGTSVLWSSDRYGHLEIYMAALDISATPTLKPARQVSNDGENAQNPTMTPDGWVVYRSLRSSEPGIRKVHVESSEDHLLYPGRQLGVPEVSPDGAYALFIDRNRANQRATIRVVEVADGAIVPFEIPIDYVVDEWNADIRWGRARWGDNGRSILFVGATSDGTPAVYRQAFMPGVDTTATRETLVTSEPGKLAESFDISPDDSRIVVSFGTYWRNAMIAEGVPGIVAAHPNGR